MEELVVRLRPFEEADLVCFDRFANEPEYSPFEWTGFHSSQPWRVMWREHRLLGGPYCLVVADVADDSFVGWVDWRQNDRPGPGVWEFGVLIDPEHRGRGAGTAAQRLLVDYLRDGQWRDGYIYGMVRTDWERAASAANRASG